MNEWNEPTRTSFTATTDFVITNKNRHDIERTFGMIIPPIGKKPKDKSHLSKMAKKRHKKNKNKKTHRR